MKSCYDCGRDLTKGPDLVLPADIWRQISPTHDLGGVLCPNCIHDRLVAAGFADGSVPATFTSGPMLDAAKDIATLLTALKESWARIEELEASEGRTTE